MSVYVIVTKWKIFGQTGENRGKHREFENGIRVGTLMYIFFQNSLRWFQFMVSFVGGNEILSRIIQAILKFPVCG